MDGWVDRQITDMYGDYVRVSGVNYYSTEITEIGLKTKCGTFRIRYFIQLNTLYAI